MPLRHPVVLVGLKLLVVSILFTNRYLQLADTSLLGQKLKTFCREAGWDWGFLSGLAGDLRLFHYGSSIIFKLVQDAHTS